MRSAAAAIFVVGCVLTCPAAAQSPKVSSESDQGAAKIDGARLDLVRFLVVADSSEKMTWDPLNFAGLYTKLVIREIPLTSNTKYVRDYDRETRNWFASLFQGRQVSVTGLVKAEIHDPDLSTTLPLFSIGHDSRQQAPESWDTSYVKSFQDSPLFRIGPSSTWTLKPTASQSTEYSSTSTAVIIKAVQSAVSLAAPSSALLTTLSRDEIGKSSQAIDNVIGQLQSKSLSEEVDTSHAISKWRPPQLNDDALSSDCKTTTRSTSCETAAITLQAVIPTKFIKGKLATGVDPNYPDAVVVGAWSIELACPRVSVFSPRTICQSLDLDAGFRGTGSDLGKEIKDRERAVAQEVNAQQILGAHLSSQITIKSFIQTQAWYTDFLKNTDRKKSDVALLCSNAMDALYTAGLNKFDAALSLWAISDGLPGLMDDPSDATSAAGAAPAATKKPDLRLQAVCINYLDSKPGQKIAAAAF